MKDLSWSRSRIHFVIPGSRSETRDPGDHSAMRLPLGSGSALRAVRNDGGKATPLGSSTRARRRHSGRSSCSSA
ncbi:MAG: hypothetical protein GC206_10590 [Alphaproteobacteria bacterium]|nr:hypothetical protein [Alphaproteobacteria bacterium]